MAVAGRQTRSLKHAGGTATHRQPPYTRATWGLSPQYLPVTGHSVLSIPSLYTSERKGSRETRIIGGIRDTAQDRRDRSPDRRVDNQFITAAFIIKEERRRMAWVGDWGNEGEQDDRLDSKLGGLLVT